MAEESTTPDLEGLVRGEYQATTRRDVGAAISSYAPDAAWEMLGLGTSFVGADAIRGVAEDWIGSREDFGIDGEEIIGPSKGAALRVSVQEARLADSTGRVRYRLARVSERSDGKIARPTGYPEVKETPIAAERLVRERG